MLRAMSMLRDQVSVQHGQIMTTPRSSTTVPGSSNGWPATADRATTLILVMPSPLTNQATSTLQERVLVRVLVLIMPRLSTIARDTSNGLLDTTGQAMAMTKRMRLPSILPGTFMLQDIAPAQALLMITPPSNTTTRVLITQLSNTTAQASSSGQHATMDRLMTMTKPAPYRSMAQAMCT